MQMRSVAVHEGFRAEESAVKSSGTMRKRQKADIQLQGDANETDQRRLLILEEVRCRLQEEDPQYKSGTAQGTRSQEIQRRQCVTRNPERTNVQRR